MEIEGYRALVSLFDSEDLEKALSARLTLSVCLPR